MTNHLPLLSNLWKANHKSKIEVSLSSLSLSAPLPDLYFFPYVLNPIDSISTFSCVCPALLYPSTLIQIYSLFCLVYFFYFFYIYMLFLLCEPVFIDNF